jgi:hypothetical protein
MDRSFATFCRRQAEDGLALASQSDLFRLLPEETPGGPPQTFWAFFSCRTYVRRQGQVVKAAPLTAVRIYFAADYLREVRPYEVVCLRTPADIFHPNIHPIDGTVCVGESFLRPSTPLTEIIYQVFSILTWAKWSHFALNGEAAEWARNHPEALPADTRGLKRRNLGINVRTVAVKAGATGEAVEVRP